MEFRKQVAKDSFLGFGLQYFKLTKFLLMAFGVSNVVLHD